MRGVRMMIFALAFLSAGGAMWLMRSALESRANVPQAPAPVANIAPPVEAPRTVDILVASRQIRAGEMMSMQDVRWQPMLEASVSEFYTRRDREPRAAEELERTAAKEKLLPGEPITPDSIIKLDGTGVMAAILRPGMRAVSVPISDVTGAGGFILPGDYVDVLLTRQFEIIQLDEETGEEAVSHDVQKTDTVLETVRILAIDQRLQEETDSRSAVGNTATLELTPDQVELITLTRQVAQQNRGFLTLSLRSFAEMVEKYGDGVEDVKPTTVLDLREEVAALEAKAEESRLAFEENKTKPKEEPAAEAEADAPQPPKVILVRSGVPISVQAPLRNGASTQQ